MAKLSFLLAGGGSAGHVNPLIATATELRRRHPDARIEALGYAGGLEAELVPSAGFPLNTIPRVRIPRRPSSELFTLPSRIRKSLRQTSDIVERLQPAAIIGFGGDLSFPAYRVGFTRDIPVIVHEQNARPGLSNTYGARNADVVALTFPSSPLKARKGTTTVTGLPLRAAIEDLVLQKDEDPRGVREESAHALGLDPNLTTLLVTGGSLGALSINTAMSQVIDQFAGFQVIHLTGKGKDGPVREAWESAGSPATYRVLDYLTNMDQALGLADIALTRSGAGTVVEMAALGIPAIYVPLPVGNGEQRLNAQDVVGAGGGLLIDDNELDGAWLNENLLPLMSDSNSRAAMSTQARSVGVNDGTKRLVDQIEAACITS